MKSVPKTGGDTFHTGATSQHIFPVPGDVQQFTIHGTHGGMVHSKSAAEERHHTAYITQRTISAKHHRPRVLTCVSHCDKRETGPTEFEKLVTTPWEGVLLHNNPFDHCNE